MVWPVRRCQMTHSKRPTLALEGVRRFVGIFDPRQRDETSVGRNAIFIQYAATRGDKCWWQVFGVRFVLLYSTTGKYKDHNFF